MTPLYTAISTSVGGRAGSTKSEDGIIDLKLTVPKSMGGDGARGTNPEQLFASGYSACFGGALGVVARMQKIDIGAPEITGKVTIGKEGEGYKLSVELEGHFAGMPKDQAMSLMEAAHKVCPYSNATRGNIDVKLSVR